MFTVARYFPVQSGVVGSWLLPAPIASVMLWLYISDFSSSASGSSTSAPLISALDVEPDTAYRQQVMISNIYCL